MSERDYPTIIQGATYRLSFLTSRLIRLEYDPAGAFEDRPTQLAQNRHFPFVAIQQWRTACGIEVRTEFINLFYDEKPFSPGGLWVENRTECKGIYATWHYGDPVKENLGGTTRTLDEVEGETPLEPGILSRLCGYSVLDDSMSPVLTEDGWYEPRRSGIQDLYLFCYGTDYRQALRDFFQLSGKPPLLPRFALGNWWSRYYAYTDQEYLALIRTFQGKGIPLSVAVLDMDWHITETGPESKGWTGYSWNRGLIREPVKFIEDLHHMGLKVTLNLHPAEGIQSHEGCYPKVAQELKKDVMNRQRIPFDATDREFIRAYFSCVLEPLEKDGVDFWWVDWQQGNQSRLPGVDPLWVLNHYHTLHCEKIHKRALILSRYSGPGSHRYPIGFSGDSVISWRTLSFQPYFTSTASNIGYGWWSHDIGGHTHGNRDPELQIRWLQLGVFSPILRMHSTSNQFNGKEPWRYSPEVEKAMTELLRLRHRLIPYLYSINWRCHDQGETLISPMYYRYPNTEEAYRFSNQYFFGSELLVMPITSPGNAELEMGSVTGWLPDGLYYDYFTGMPYAGGKMVRIFRSQSEMPVFARAGAVIPMDGSRQESNFGGCVNPETLEIRVYAGDDGQFELYEDDGESIDSKYVITTIKYLWQNGVDSTVLIEPRGTGFKHLPTLRNYRIQFYGLQEGSTPVVYADGKTVPSKALCYGENNLWTLNIPDIPASASLKITLRGESSLACPSPLLLQEQILHRAHISYELKDRIYHLLSGTSSILSIISSLRAMQLPNDLFDALLEPMLCLKQFNDIQS